MTSWLPRFGITLVVLGFASNLPPTVGAQPHVYVTQWGSQGSGPGEFNGPWGVATDAAGNVYVADSGNHRIQKFTGIGTFLTQWGTLGSGNGEFDYPTGVATDAVGNVYVTDSNNFRIQKFTSTGVYVTQWGSAGSGNGEFSASYGVTVDASGNVYVVDTYNKRIQKFTSNGTYLTQWGAPGSGNGQFELPIGAATDAAGNVYVADSNNFRVQKFTSAGTFLTKWGTYGSGNGELNQPGGMATDGAGNVLVSELFGSRIQKFTAAGTYLTQWGTFGDGNGQFNYPTGVATDAAGNVYVSDRHRIQKFGPPPPHGTDHPKILVHVTSPVAKNPCAQGLLVDCGAAQVAGEVADETGPFYFAYLLAARNQIASLSEVDFGVSYDKNQPGDESNGIGVDVFAWHLCADMEFSAGNWPAPGSTNQIRWNVPQNCQTGPVAVAGYFYMGAYTPDAIHVTQVSSLPARVLDCSQTVTELGPEDLGHATFSLNSKLPGCNPCLLNCLAPTAVQPTTWSGIKTKFMK